MLISLSIANWRSFKGTVCFSMIATREKQSKESLAKLPIGINILPISAIYGGNASGKTSLIKALSFIQNFIVKGTLPDESISVEPFILDPEYSEIPSSFKVQILASNNNCYEFSFIANKNQVVEECLTQILKTKDKVLFRRKDQNFEFLDPDLRKDERLVFISQGTRNNQLFLTNCVGQNHEVFRPIYDWFRNQLSIITPESRFGNFHKFLPGADPLHEKINEILPFLDTGIVALGVKVVDINGIGLTSKRINEFHNMKEGRQFKLANFSGGMLIVTKKNNALEAKQIVTKHCMSNGDLTDFEIDLESDGSKRCIDLLPIFIDLSTKNSKAIYFIDEIDRSLHSELFIQLIEFYSSYLESESRVQLVFTTHNLLTMDQNLLRRDEMWATERNQDGIGHLISFSEYKDIRNDKDIRKSYRQGRLGGMPNIRLNTV